MVALHNTEYYLLITQDLYMRLGVFCFRGDFPFDKYICHYICRPPLADIPEPTPPRGTRIAQLAHHFLYLPGAGGGGRYNCKYTSW